MTVAGGSERRFEARGTRNGRHGPVGFHGAGLNDGLTASSSPDACPGEAGFQLFVTAFVMNDGDFGVQTTGLFGQQGGVASADKGPHLYLIRNPGKKVDR
ncbi:hypothetical protein GOX01_20130 [Gluconobacter oxydans]|nr:hypothetical protein GOX01_20130 [Gluconobacter oxydans]